MHSNLLLRQQIYVFSGVFLKFFSMYASKMLNYRKMGFNLEQMRRTCSKTLEWQTTQFASFRVCLQLIFLVLLQNLATNWVCYCKKSRADQSPVKTYQNSPASSMFIASDGFQTKQNLFIYYFEGVKKQDKNRNKHLNFVSQIKSNYGQ